MSSLGKLTRTLTTLGTAMLLSAGFIAGPAMISTAEAASAGPAAIAAVYAKPGVASRLGASKAPTACNLVNSGCYRSFTMGIIIWSSSTGAQIVHRGAIHTRWVAEGSEHGTLGYPTTAEYCGQRNSGCYQKFAKGSLYWSAASGAVPVHGAMLTRYASLKLHNGFLAYPVATQNCRLVRGGCKQQFQGGVIWWQSGTGAWSTHGGAIQTAWINQGGEKGRLGYPKTNENCTNGYCKQSFEGGYVDWTAKAGARTHFNAAAAPSVPVINKRRPLSPITYGPAATINVYGATMERTAGLAMQRLIAAARAAGAGMTAVSGYRSYATQKSLYYNYVGMYGQAQADLISARPGYSEHQTGLVLDIGDSSGQCGLLPCFENTRSGAWAKANAWRYGFIVRYPNGYTNITGYSYEPWHLRYVGTPLSTDMHIRKIPTLEQRFSLPAAPRY
ncbi:D-alanyl-D-alanine carboxypeptidase family protein [Pseudarthrobacter sp. J1738]|uniref:D-alanyl-D-alanine carboxypeptidase family protein n=1 Tax=unclassified Pseudarthrobacter TaxID=2647000 RepID=UPI003D2BAE11